jgi:hypothetical protein
LKKIVDVTSCLVVVEAACYDFTHQQAMAAGNMCDVMLSMMLARM